MDKLKFGQKAVLAMLVLAFAAAFTLGQKGVPGRTGQNAIKRETNDVGIEETEKSMSEEAKKEQLSDEKQLRVHREGKVLNGSLENPCVVLDAGHGGYDPGKIGINNSLEKDVNLAVTLMTKEYLEAAGVKVVMTRQEDVSLGGESEDNKKVRDLKQRIEIVESANPILAVSIHQNSYPEEYVSGAQVFYYRTSAEGRKLAAALQERLVTQLDPTNDRQIKENDSYYLLKKTSVPLVIVEGGFLSNWNEAVKLCDEEYQDALAWAIYLGIMDYLETVA